jgi:ABC-type Fe3+ transport system substrate-binding protein
LAQVAWPYHPSTGRRIGIAARSTVFVYNKTKPVASALPHSLLDLADPVWRERWATHRDVAPRRRGGRFGAEWARQRANAFSEAAAREFAASALV